MRFRRQPAGRAQPGWAGVLREYVDRLWPRVSKQDGFSSPEAARHYLGPVTITTANADGDRCGARTRAGRVETHLDTRSRGASQASARVPTRHARVRAPRLPHRFADHQPIEHHAGTVRRIL